ncbi:hypothetical protein BC830DRAFT_930514 [Chytriomyces sp. MP71]|nr:hypothetical protein BC830DRAFT_930514 [Chytriomyces sp. MP71]
MTRPPLPVQVGSEGMSLVAFEVSSVVASVESGGRKLDAFMQQKRMLAMEPSNANANTDAHAHAKRDGDGGQAGGRSREEDASEDVCGFEHLPLEVAALVVRRIHRSDLAVAVRVCRVWRDVATPLLWKALKFTRAAALHLVLLRNSSKLANTFSNRFSMVDRIDMSRINTSAGRLDLQISIQFKILLSECTELRFLDLSNCLWVRIVYQL